jgi:hypothetical protein
LFPRKSIVTLSLICSHTHHALSTTCIHVTITHAQRGGETNSLYTQKTYIHIHTYTTDRHTRTHAALHTYISTYQTKKAPTL